MSQRFCLNFFTGCSEKTHVLERVRETILTPVKAAEPVKRPRPERREPSDAKREKDLDDILAKLKNIPGGENMKVRTDSIVGNLASACVRSCEREDVPMWSQFSYSICAHHAFAHSCPYCPLSVLIIKRSIEGR